MMEYSVSVVIPTYKRARLLERAIRSVLLQTHPAFEILVVENGRSAEGKPVVERLPKQAPHLRYFYNSKPSVSLARNTGIQSSKGEFVAFLDDDDEWLPEKLERQIQVFKENPEAGLVTCRAWLSDETKGTLELAPHFNGPLSFKTLVTEGTCIWSPSSVLVRKECLDAAGLFNPRFDSAEDYEWYLRLARIFPIQRVEEPLIRYRVHSENKSIADAHQLWEAAIRTLKGLQPSPALGVTRKMIHATIRKYAQRLHHCAVDAMDAGNYKKALGCYLLSVRHDPLIGLKNSWGRFRHPFYRVLRPYLAAGYCSWRSLAGRTEVEQNA